MFSINDRVRRVTARGIHNEVIEVGTMVGTVVKVTPGNGARHAGSSDGKQRVRVAWDSGWQSTCRDYQIVLADSSETGASAPSIREGTDT